MNGKVTYTVRFGELNLDPLPKILTKKGKIITKEGEELVIGISYTLNDSELYKSDSVEDEFFNKTTLECIEKLIFNAITFV